jgi:hypothetical protein
MDLVLPPDQTPLGRGKDALVGADGAPDYRRSRRNRTVRFALFGARASGFCSFHV